MLDQNQFGTGNFGDDFTNDQSGRRTQTNGSFQLLPLNQ
jgi:hypothetical protein